MESFFRSKPFLIKTYCTSELSVHQTFLPNQYFLHISYLLSHRCFLLNRYFLHDQYLLYNEYFLHNRYLLHTIYLMHTEIHGRQQAIRISSMLLKGAHQSPKTITSSHLISSHILYISFPRQENLRNCRQLQLISKDSAGLFVTATREVRQIQSTHRVKKTLLKRRDTPPCRTLPLPHPSADPS